MLLLNHYLKEKKIVINNKFNIVWKILSSDKGILFIYEGVYLLKETSFNIDRNFCSEDALRITLNKIVSINEMKHIYEELSLLIEDLDEQNKFSDFHCIYSFLEKDSQLIYYKRKEFCIISEDFIDMNKTEYNMEFFYKNKEDRMVHYYNKVTKQKHVNVADLMITLLNYKSFKAIKLKDLKYVYDEIQDKKIIQHDFSQSIEYFSMPYYYFL